MELSSIQQDIWINQSLHPDSPMYNVGGYAYICGDLKIDVLQAAIKNILENASVFETLYAFLTEEMGNKVQLCKRYHIDVIDFSKEDTPEKSCLNWMDSDIKNKINLFRHAIEVTILKQSNTAFYWYIKSHHLVFDGYAMALIFKKVFKLYASIIHGMSEEFNEPVRYSDFIAYEKDYRLSNAYRNDETFWSGKIALDISSNAFGVTYNSRSESNSLCSKRQELKILRKTFNKIKEFTQSNNYSIQNYFIGVIYTANFLYNDEAFILGIPNHNRSSHGFKNILGTFVNICPLILSGNIGEFSFSELMENIQKEMRLSYRHYKYLTLSEDRNLETQQYNTLFSYQKYPYSIDFEGLNVAIKYLSNGEQKENLIFHLLEYSDTDDLILAIDYKEMHFSFERIASLLKHLDVLVNKLCELPDPHQLLKDIDYLSAEERTLLISGFNDTDATYKEGSIVSLIHDQFLSAPDSVAVRYKSTVLSYSELDDLSGRFSNYLRQKGIEHEDLVGVKLNRSEKLAWVLLGILKSGGAYVPIDPKYPSDRIDYILADSQCKHVIDQAALDEFWFGRESFSPEVIPLEITGPELAYIIYTSGSTGQPKGVMITHSNVYHFVNWAKSAFQESDFNTTFAVTSICFDLSVFELFYTLSEGKTVAILDSPLDINDRLQDATYGKILLNTVPSVVEGLLSEKANLAFVSVLNMAGEPISPGIISQLDLTGIEVRNLYGPSETTTYSTCHRIFNKGKVLIGKPISNTRIYLLDGHLNPIAIGAVGEICIGGKGVARGYLNRPDLTASRFISSPFISGDILYKTGDYGRWLSDGTIEFLGRQDDQVKIRGYRIELGEIEKALTCCKGITRAVVLVRDQNAGLDKELVAFIVSDHEPDMAAIRNELALTLPSYMLPSRYIVVEEFPLNANGKTDKKALLSLDVNTTVSNEAHISPRNETETALAKMWAEILSLDADSISVKDDFFVLGGHSLKISLLLNQINKRFQVHIALIDIFNCPVLEHQARLIINSEKTIRTDIPQAVKKESYALSSAQNRLWILSQFTGGNRAYNMTGSYVFYGDLDKKAFAKAYMLLIERHEVLRTYFKKDSFGEIRQFIATLSESDFSLKLEDRTLEAFNERILTEINVNEGNKTFDLYRAPLIKAKIISFANGHHVLNFVVHHIISDEWSLNIIFKELAALYRNSRLTPLKMHYKDYSEWEKIILVNDTLTDKYYWEKQLSGDLPLIDLPFYNNRPRIKSYKGNTIRTYLDENAAAKLKAISMNEGGGTLFMGAMGLIFTLLHRYTGQNDIIVGVPMNNRKHIDLDEQIGLYVNTLPIRVKFDETDNFYRLLARMKALVLDAQTHSVYPLDEIVKNLKLGKDPSRNPLFDVMVVFENTETNDYKNACYFDDLTIVKYQEDKSKVSKFDLTFYVREKHDKVEVAIEYNTDIFDAITIESILTHLDTTLIKVTSDPHQLLKDIDYLSAEERTLLISGFNDTDATYKEGSIVSLIHDQFLSAPDSAAVRYKSTVLSYSELDDLSGRFSNYLRQKGIEHEDLVGVKLNRSEKLAWVLLGILKSGGAYVPIDPKYPSDRIDYILADSQCKHVIDQAALDEFWFGRESFSPEVIPLEITGPELAYIIYTSGSTGQPKGVMITHSNVYHFVNWAKSAFQDSDFNTTFAVTSICFDLSVFELFYTLSEGKTVAILDSPLDINDRLQDATYGKILLNTVPSVVEGLLSEKANLAFVSVLNMAGEPISPGIISQLDLTGIEVRNLYGPSETTTYSTCHRIFNKGKVLIGKPISNTRIYLLDGHLNPIAIGAVGEICIGGKGVARGYLNRPDLTASRFISSPFISGDILYKTGDYGRWLSDGTIEFLGRQDDQVKIRGYRIELGEIEKALTCCKGITRAVVLVRDQNAGLDKELVAFIVSDHEPDMAAIRNELALTLPSYMLPSRYIVVEEFPLNANGKTDKKALLSLDVNTTVSNEAHISPRNETETELAKMWAEILSLDADSISVKDDFFALGGHSLKAVQLISRIRENLNTNISLEDVFEKRDIEALGKYLDQNKEALIDVPIERVQRSAYKMKK
ncbi:non-ribosomal peptide synthetase [Chryseobacterium sp. JV558]|uniref:non-ribosomal peptide synthetase n=1 Tax=Chryseobacterium sp. JV558 TaxID=2663236 RepID=UPI00299D17E3|nr:non-ribosomal peptide synthetase [Chryseobacterium sp. JV558]MDW9382509.1 amino acid adenylation domain-containing protein [Chryseobacterium sp. JV558]